MRACQDEIRTCHSLSAFTIDGVEALRQLSWVGIPRAHTVMKVVDAERAREKTMNLTAEAARAARALGSSPA